ncbi:hypothetical protein Sme01_68480 [Sphaerisporangium melleum]|uniref:Uncharacterized protein n=1 Tax=Sphaerisporangium melleum TaxID=321316 RepID=A0A917RKD6_9ACTN|nr:hypothetical protein [Sphaerisporangium melleum]GGL11997.1 hypothetical protein GCM10007964_62510 [Sphaerisporangium melleum]GII74372.1 hypothetical protein Sme01_68480 [Sphaerisporangium melleum]
MAKIHIPGDELEAVSRSLGFVLDNIDTGTTGIDLDRAVGSGLVDEARNFERRWKDGRFQLRRQAEAIKKAVDQIVEKTKETDDEAVAHLEGK